MRPAFQTVMLLVVSVSMLAAFGTREAKEYVGRISIKGNVPHTFVVLSTEAEMFHLEGTRANELGDQHQNCIVRVIGHVQGSGKEASLPVIRVVSYTVVAGPDH